MFIKERIKSSYIVEFGRRRKLRGVNELLNYLLMPRDNIVVMKDGSCSASFIYKGSDLESSTDNVLDIAAGAFRHAANLLGDKWMLDFNSFRIESTFYQEGNEFPDLVSELIDAERKAQYTKEEEHFDTYKVLTITKAPDKDIPVGVKNFFIDSNGNEELETESLDTLIDKFEEHVEMMINTLSRYIYFERLRGSFLLTFLHYCITGKKVPVGVPKTAMHLDSYLASEDFVGGIKPRMGDKHIAVIDFAEYPEEAHPDILERLDRLAIPYRWSVRYIPFSTETARDFLKLHHQNWSRKVKGFIGTVKEVTGIPHTNIDRNAADMQDEVEEAQGKNNSQVVKYGLLTNVVVLFHEDEEKLKTMTSDVVKVIQQEGFVARVEKINAIEAFLGSIPGHGYYNVRKPLMSTEVLSNLAPCTSFYQGEEQCPCPLYPEDSPPLFYAKTDGSTPFRFNLHKSDVGHTMIIGPTGYGKTTLLGLIMAQHRKYKNSQIFVFDKDNSSKIPIMALNGEYYNIGKKSSVQFAPLQGIEDAEEFDYACRFVEELVELQRGSVTSEHKETIRHTMEVLKGNHPEDRSLPKFKILCQDEEIKGAINEYANDSIIGRLLSSSEEKLNISNITGFEFGWLLEQGEKNCLPVVSSLFRQLEKRFKNGYPALLILDEGWLYLDNPIIARKLKDWLKTLRKLNVAVIFASQSLSDVHNSPIKTVLLESCQTKIYLPNEHAGDEEIYMIYRGCGLNDRQIDLIQNAQPKRDYYVCNSYGNRMIDLELGPLSLAFLGVSRKDDQDKFYSIYDKSNPKWVAEWLKYKKLDEWVEYVKEKLRK